MHYFQIPEDPKEDVWCCCWHEDWRYFMWKCRVSSKLLYQFGCIIYLFSYHSCNWSNIKVITMYIIFLAISHLQISRMDCYVRFCASQLTAASCLQKLTEVKPGFEERLRVCQADQRVQGMPLSYYLLKVSFKVKIHVHQLL